MGKAHYDAVDEKVMNRDNWWFREHIDLNDGHDILIGGAVKQQGQW